MKCIKILLKIKKRAVSPQVNTEEEIYQNTTLAGHQSSKVLWKTVLVIEASTHQTCHTITKPSQKIQFQRFVCFKETFLQGGDQLTQIFTGGLKQQHGERKDCCSAFIVYFQLLFLIYLSSCNDVSRLFKRVNVQATKCLHEVSWYYV